MKADLNDVTETEAEKVNCTVMSECPAVEKGSDIGIVFGNLLKFRS